MNLPGKTALIAGATSGLGLAAAEALAAKGVRVAILGQRIEVGREIAARLPGAFAVQANIGDAAATQAAIDEVLERFGSIDININTAGIHKPLSILPNADVDLLAAFEETIRVNLTGTFNVMRLAIAAMLKNEMVDEERGVIINTSSGAAYEGVSGHAAYAASKSAIVGMMLPAARDLAGRGIRINTIVAGAFDTPILGGVTEEVRETFYPTILNPQRFGRPEEFANLALHIVENSYLNSAAIRLDGGFRLAVQSNVG